MALQVTLWVKESDNPVSFYHLMEIQGLAKVWKVKAAVQTVHIATLFNVPYS
jgi:hypothetical protein